MNITKEQETCISTLDKGLVVSASAGTGKTFSMIERVKNLIINYSVSLDNIVVLAFNNSIACENKQKISKSLINYLVYEKEGQSIEKIKFIKNEIEKINLGNISTVDAFSQKIFKEYSYIIDFPDDMMLITEEKSEEILEEIINEELKKHAKENKKEYKHILFSSSNDRNNLIEIFKTVINFARSNDDIDKTIKNICLDKSAYNALLNKAKDYVYFFYMKRFKKIDELAFKNRLNIQEELEENSSERIDSLIEKIHKIIYENISYMDLYEYFNFIVENNKLATKQKNNQNYYKDLLILYKNSINEFLDILKILNQKQDYYSTDFKNYLEVISKLSNEIFTSFQNYKKNKKIFDFKDATYYANLILESEHEEAKKILENINFIFVDEYQDISPIQERFIKNITKKGTPSKILKQKNSTGANVFVVGDIKQAINGFRGTSSREFLNRINLAKEDEIKNGKLLKFNYNFRSSQKILNFVNNIMIELMDQNFGDVNYEDEQFIIDNSIVEESDSEISISFFPIKKNSIDYQNINKICTKIKNLVNNSKNVNNENFKNYKYHDVAVLSRNLPKKTIEQYANIFKDNKIPFNIKKDIQDDFYTKFKIISYLFKVIHYSNDNYSLFFLITSNLFNFTYEEIGKIRLINKNETLYNNLISYKMTNKEDNITKKIDKIIDTLSVLREYSEFHTVSQLINYILGKKRFLFFNEKNLIDDIEDDLLKFIPFIESLESNNSLIEFINEEENIKIPKDISNFQIDSVTITTVHQSKGLGWPIVFVVDNSVNNNSYKQVLTDYEYGIQFKNIDYESKFIEKSLLYNLVKNIKEKKEAEEELRLFYVAITRAKNMNHIFVLNGDAKPEKCGLLLNNFSKMLIYVNIIKKYNGEEFLNNYGLRIRDNMIEQADDLDIFEKLNLEEEKENEIEKKYISKLNGSNLTLTTSVTEINKIFKEDKTNIIYSSEKSDKELGIIYHQIFELLDFNKIKTYLTKDNEAELIEEEIKQILDKKIKSKEKKFVSIEKIIEIFLEENFYNILLNAKKIYKEFSFIMVDNNKNIYRSLGKEIEELNLSNRQIKGKIDLIIVDKNNDYFLIDYKLTSHDEKTLKDDYKNQLMLYKKSLNDINKKVKAMYLLDINQIKLIEV